MKKQKYLLIVAIIMIIALLSSCNQTETITCGACGATISSDIKFCAECGANLATDTTLAPEVTQTPDSTSESEKNQSSETTSAPETTEAPHVHVWSEWTTTLEATCTAEGKQERSCSCGEKEAQSISTLGHTEVIDSAVAATCTTSGLSDGKHCNVCGVITVAQQYVAALGHNEEILSAVAPTCTQGGKTEGKICKTCNATFVFQTQIPATGHTSVIDKAVSATCTESGLTEGKHCSICNAVIVAQTTVNALGHTEVIDKAVAATCTTAGKTEGKHCSKCNTVISSQETVAAIGHKWLDANCTTPKRCSKCGTTEGAATNHNWKDATCTAPKICTKCGTTQGSVAAHSYTATKIPATCTTQGYTTYVCKCGDTYSDSYTNTSHNYSNYKCTNCGAIDQFHTYEYLIAWVKQNGTTDGSHTQFRYNTGSVIYALSYSAQYDSLSITRSYSYEGKFIYVALYLDNFFYLCSVGDIEMGGYISPSAFTSNSAISYTTYKGDSTSRHDMAEFSRLSINDLIDWLDWCLNVYEVGITIKDLGFNSY